MIGNRCFTTGGGISCAGLRLRARRLLQTQPLAQRRVSRSAPARLGSNRALRCGTADPYAKLSRVSGPGVRATGEICLGCCADIFEFSRLAVSRAATRVSRIPPEHSSTLGRRLGLTSLRQNPTQFCSSLLDAVACKRASFRVCSHVPRDVFQAAAAWTAKPGAHTKLQT